MLTKTSTSATSYLTDWPAHYYELDTAAERKHALDEAEAEGLFVPADLCRRELLLHRFFSINPSGTVDAFTHAFTMIQASASAGVSFFQKKSKKRELQSYMMELCLQDFSQYADNTAENSKITDNCTKNGNELPKNDTSQHTSAEIWELTLKEEWQDFARRFIASCAGSKAYCATIFGVMPMNDSKAAEKIAAEILLVTKDYPALFGCEEVFAPFRQVMCDTYCQMIEAGENYLNAECRHASRAGLLD